MWFHRRDQDRDLCDEFETHLSLEVERQIANGLSPADAEAVARRKFGNMLLYREQTGDLRPGAALERFWLDVRNGLRALTHRPGGTIAAVVALAVAMGVPAAVLMIFANISTAVFPLVRDPNALVMMVETPPNRPNQQEPATEATWRVWRAHAGVAMMSAVQPPMPLTFSAGELPESITVQPMATTLLSMLGVAPALGRGFVESDGAPGTPQTAIISHTFWQTRLGGSDRAIGSTLTIDGRQHTVVGVMPRGFWITSRSIDVWVPTPVEGFANSRYLAIARLGAGDTRAHLAKRVSALSSQIASANPGREGGWSVRVDGLGADSILFDMVRQPGVLMLIVATGLALIVACANVAMLMVARGSARQKETAVRSALGASRGRLVRQFLTESTIVALAGAAVALLGSYAAMRIITARASAELPVSLNVRMDWRIVGAVTSLAIIVGLLAGLAPALSDSRVNLMATLKEAGFFGSTPGKQRFRRGLLIAEVGLTVMLIAVVSLLVRGVFDLERTPPGFDQERLLTVRLDDTQHLGGQATAPPPSRATLDRLRGLAGIESAATVQFAPPGVGRDRLVTMRAGTSTETPRMAREYVNGVSGDYFGALGLKVIAGRTFSDNDHQPDDVAVVSLAFARRHWPGSDAVGRVLTVEGDRAPRQVIGVVSDQLLYQGRRAPTPVVFIPIDEVSQADPRPHSLVILIRTSPAVPDVVASIRKAIAQADPLQTVRVAAVKDVMAIGAQEVRVGAIMASPLMLLAWVLTVSGIYGLLAQNVSQRTHELAVRMALGAGRQAMLRLVARDGLRLSAVGAVLGILAALMIDRSLNAFLLGMPGEEPIVLAASALAMMLVTLIAAVAPCRRALRIDPGRTLRYE